MSELRKLTCIPCRGDEPVLSIEEIQRYLEEAPDWMVIERAGVKQLERSFKFDNFEQALEFAIKVGEVAEAQDHHPVLVVEWGKVTVTWFTHVIKGLHKNDFIMAAKTDGLYSP
ncbi:MAG: 4a-hydroxytetrahydrobiopterin dehydratase [Anaerolineales bacterium]|nr:4a-hydroxytetrahydrobiopterin dehydratase [Anaerolineales bacterium]